MPKLKRTMLVARGKDGKRKIRVEDRRTGKRRKTDSGGRRKIRTVLPGKRAGGPNNPTSLLEVPASALVGLSQERARKPWEVRVLVGGENAGKRLGGKATKQQIRKRKREKREQKEKMEEVRRITALQKALQRAGKAKVVLRPDLALKKPTRQRQRFAVLSKDSLQEQPDLSTKEGRKPKIWRRKRIMLAGKRPNPQHLLHALLIEAGMKQYLSLATALHSAGFIPKGLGTKTTPEKAVELVRQALKEISPKALKRFDNGQQLSARIEKPYKHRKQMVIYYWKKSDKPSKITDKLEAVFGEVILKKVFL